MKFLAGGGICLGQVRAGLPKLEGEGGEVKSQKHLSEDYQLKEDIAMVTYTDVKLVNKQLNKDDLDYLVESTLALIKNKPVTLDGQEHLAHLLARLQETRDNYEKSQELKGHQQLEKLSDLDRQRDLDYSDLRFYVRAQLRHRQANRQEAARSLYQLLQDYKEMRNKAQAEQSALMNDLLQKLGSKENRSRLTLLGAMDFYNNLKASQEMFETAYFKQMEGRSQRVSNQRETARRQMEKTYRMAYRYLLCLEFFGKDTSHQELLGIFNDVRLTFNETQARKAGQAKKKARAQVAGLLEEPGKED